MRTGDLIALCLSSLKRRKLRTALTVLGVVIGTASIIIMVSLGIGQSEISLELIESSASLTTVSVYSTGTYEYDPSNGKGQEPKYLTDEVIETFRHLPHAQGASPILNYYVIAKQGVYETSFNIVGASHDYLEQIPLSEGHIPPKNESALSLIYGNMIRRDFTNSKTGKGYWDTGEEPDVDLMNRPVFLIFDRDRYYQSQQPQSASEQGAQSSEEQTAEPVTPPKKYIVPTAGLVEGSSVDWNRYSYSAYCDVEALKTQLKAVFRKSPIPGQPTNKKGKPYSYFVYDEAEVYADDMDNVKELQDRITKMGYQANSNMEWVESSQKQMQTQQAMLGGIGAVSLFVAAIGIANTMMMSIYERTKEIGVMKVLGCEMTDIRNMFLLESGMIGFLGGVLGTALSYGISKLINVLYYRQQLADSAESAALYGFASDVSENISRIPIWLSLLALFFAVLIGMLAGLFPARRAMRLSALSAIRAE